MTFSVGDVKDYRKLKGCVIRSYIRDNQLWKDIKAAKCLRFMDNVYRIEINHVDLKKRIFLMEIRAHNLKDAILQKSRYNVFYITTPIDDSLSIEGNYGKGERFKDEWMKEH